MPLHQQQQSEVPVLAAVRPTEPAADIPSETRTALGKTDGFDFRSFLFLCGILNKNRPLHTAAEKSPPPEISDFHCKKVARLANTNTKGSVSRYTPFITGSNPASETGEQIKSKYIRCCRDYEQAFRQ